MIGERLKKLRKERHLTTRQLGDILNVSNSLITMYEKNQRTPSVEALEKIADYFNVDTNYLLGKSELTTFIYLDETTKRIAELVRGMDDKRKHAVLKMVEVIVDDEDN